MKAASNPPGHFLLFLFVVLLAISKTHAHPNVAQMAWIGAPCRFA